MLTDTKVKNLKPKDKPYKKADSNGLFIYVTALGTKYWRQKYRINGREKLLSHGEYPFITLQKARNLRDQAREQIKQGTDPALTKQAEKVGKRNDFESIARAWHETQSPDWSTNHISKVIVSLEKDIFPAIGTIPITEIRTPLLLDTLRQIEKRGSFEQSRRVAQRVSSVFRFAIASGITDYNPAQDLQGALKKPKKKNYAFIDAKELPKFTDALDAVNAHPVIKLATEMLMLTFSRTGELRSAEWTDFNLHDRIWERSADKMKNDRTHLVPLSDRAIEILAELKPYTGHRQFVFASPSKPRQPISDMAILQVIKRMGYQGKMTGHGFRHLASTTLNEMGYNPDVIEKQLAHIDGTTRGVYNKAEYLDERTKLMQDWSTFVLSSSVKVIPIGKAK